MAGQVPKADTLPALHGRTPGEMVRMNAAERTGNPWLTWRDENHALEILLLTPGERYSIGRRASMSVVIAWDRKVSNLHAILECVGEEWVISDDGLSTNGTWVNGERIHEDTRLGHKDVIRMGGCLLSFRRALAEIDMTTTVFDDVADGVPEFDERDRAVLLELCRDYIVHERPGAVDNNRIAVALGFGVDMVKNRLREMYRACAIDPDNELARGAKRAELMAFVVRHGIISPRDYAAPRVTESP